MSTEPGASLLSSLDRALLRVTSWAFRGNLTWTRRARIVLLLAPIAIPIGIVRSLLLALYSGAVGFWESVVWQAREGWFFWYRTVYRVARYGSVHDA